MSVLAEVKANNGITDAILNAARPVFAAAIWIWYDANADEVLFSKWKFIKIRVRDLRPLVEAIAGPHPLVGGNAQGSTP